MLTVIDAENELTKAERTGDRDALSKIIDDSFVGISVRGERVDMNGFIRTFCDSGLHLRTLAISDLIVREVDSISIVCGRARFEAMVGASSVTGSTEFMDCWRRTLSGWKLLSSVTVKANTEA